MNDEILGLSVVSATGMRLRELYPTVTWYREVITNLRFPHFFVFQLAVQSSEERLNYWWIEYLVTLRYRVAADTTFTSNLQEQLDTMGLKLLSDLNFLNWFGHPVKVKDARYEKEDGVLHFFFTFKIMATKPKEEVVKQMKLDLNITIGGEQIGDITTVTE